MQRIPNRKLRKLSWTTSTHTDPLRPVNPTTLDHSCRSTNFAPHVERVITSKFKKKTISPFRSHTLQRSQIPNPLWKSINEIAFIKRITMVQGECVNNSGLVSAMDRGQDAKRAGFQALQKKCQDMKSSSSSTPAISYGKSKTSSNSQFGAWGPMFQNANNFKNMHNY